MYDLGGVEVYVDGNGQAFGLDPNGSILWHIETGIVGTWQSQICCDIGLILQTENTLVKIDKDGTFWVHDGFDSTIRDVRLGQNDTVYVLTDDKLIVLYKPTVSMPSEYLIAMISVDLLISLSAGLWIADRLVKKSN